KKYILKLSLFFLISSLGLAQEIDGMNKIEQKNQIRVGVGTLIIAHTGSVSWERQLIKSKTEFFRINSRIGGGIMVEDWKENTIETSQYGIIGGNIEMGRDPSIRLLLEGGISPYYNANVEQKYSTLPMAGIAFRAHPKNGKYVFTSGFSFPEWFHMSLGYKF
ncbi:MAG: hypothetical protein MRY83_00280, partial [Flavobacteriales bacterium]|nr:hypothetical protein [Flavobacteriales bacterium]